MAGLKSHAEHKVLAGLSTLKAGACRQNQNRRQSREQHNKQGYFKKEKRGRGKQ